MSEIIDRDYANAECTETASYILIKGSADPKDINKLEELISELK